MPARHTIRFRITAVATVAVAAVLIAAGLGLVLFQRSALTSSVDQNLTQRADDLSALLQGGTALPDSFVPTSREGFTQLVGLDGVVLVSSPNLAGASPLPSKPRPEQAIPFRRWPDSTSTTTRSAVFEPPPPQPRRAPHRRHARCGFRGGDGACHSSRSSSSPSWWRRWAPWCGGWLAAPCNRSRRCDPRWPASVPPISTGGSPDRTPATKSTGWPEP